MSVNQTLNVIYSVTERSLGNDHRPRIVQIKQNIVLGLAHLEDPLPFDKERVIPDIGFDAVDQECVADLHHLFIMCAPFCLEYHEKRITCQHDQSDKQQGIAVERQHTVSPDHEQHYTQNTHKDRKY